MPEQKDTSVAAAAQQIEGLLSFDPQREETAAAPARNAAAAQDDVSDDTESTETDDVEVDAAPDEDSVSEQDETDENEPEEASEDANPAIEPPTSWSAEEKAKFKELPVELQQVVQRRESERDRAISQRMTQLSEQKKQVDAETARAAQTYQQYESTLQTLLSWTVPELNQLESTNWLQLAQDDPTEYVRRSAVRDGLRQRAGAIQQQMGHAAQEQQRLASAHHAEHVNQQFQILIDEVPEFRDPVKAKSLASQINDTMRTFGFSDQEVSAIHDARVVKVIARLSQLEAQEAARKSANGKRSSAPAPRMPTPNASPTRDDNTKKKMADQFAQLRKTGNVRDAARLIEHMI